MLESKYLYEKLVKMLKSAALIDKYAGSIKWLQKEYNAQNLPKEMHKININDFVFSGFFLHSDKFSNK